ncbi:MAG: glycoside hydrolase family 32 protein [Bryobacteraceae bacterium]|nr:glycoside hydrolase family 32 protein [Bryobacteraceae bacterium]
MRIGRRDFLGSAAFGAVGAAGAAGDSRDAAIAKAMEAITAAIPKAEADPERPVCHFRPPAQWNNDPNGTIYYKGQHHLFYQLNPYGAVWGNMHWGHARSRDLVNWEHLPVALWPSKEKGEEHVFSGAAIAGPDGRPLLFYTSIGKRDPEQWLAMPTDDELIRWEKYPENPVVSVKHHGGVDVDEWRDPFLFREQGATYMVCGGNLRPSGGRAAVQLYRATTPSLTEWKHMGTVFEYRHRETRNFECPNLFRLGARWVLLVSPHAPCEYFVGGLDLERGRFTPETHGTLDPGTSYASNISRDGQGRTILWLWGRTETNPEKAWNSVMTLPRILSVDADGFLRQTPAKEFESLRGEARKLAGIALRDASEPLGGVQGDCLDIEAELTLDTARAAGLRLRCPETGKPGIEVSFNREGFLTAGNAKIFAGRAGKIDLRLFLDKRVIEVFANEGTAAIFTTVEGAPGAMGVHAFATGGAARIESLRAWPLKPARFSLDSFRA